MLCVTVSRLRAQTLPAAACAGLVPRSGRLDAAPAAATRPGHGTRITTAAGTPTPTRKRRSPQRRGSKPPPLRTPATTAPRPHSRTGTVLSRQLLYGGQQVRHVSLRRTADRAGQSKVMFEMSISSDRQSPTRRETHQANQGAP